MRQLFLLLLSGVCFAAAVLSLPLPLPLGFVFFVIGVSLLLAAIPVSQRWLRALRERFPTLDRGIHAIDDHLPAFMRRALEGSAPTGKDVS